MRRGLALLAATAALAVPGSAESDPNQGPQTILAVLVTWGPQPYTPDELHQQLFVEANGYIRDVSFGQTSLVGDVTPWLRIKQYDDCDPTTLADMTVTARAAATAAGYDLAKYSRYLYGFAFPQRCPNLGFGDAHNVFLFGKASTRTIEHELGHTFGLSHAWSIACGTCRPVEYGDPYDAMGRYRGGHYNTLEKFTAGWLKNVPTATTNGNYVIDQLEQPSTQPQALVVHTAVNDYWFDHREPLLEDAALPEQIMNGVEVHASPSADDRNGSSPYQPGDVLILDPAGAAGADAVRPGESFAAKGAFSLTVLDHVGTHVDVRFRWTDTTAPGRPSIFSPLGVVRAKLDVQWGRAAETGSGLASYKVLLDGKVRASVPADAPRQLLLPKPKRGKHVLAVIAIDRAGNKSRPGTSKISVR